MKSESKFKVGDVIRYLGRSVACVYYHVDYVSEFGGVVISWMKDGVRNEVFLRKEAMEKYELVPKKETFKKYAVLLVCKRSTPAWAGEVEVKPAPFMMLYDNKEKFDPSGVMRQYYHILKEWEVEIEYEVSD